MRYKLFGRSGLRVSELCLGTMTFGEEWGWGSSKEESRKVFDAFVERGGNFIDTANRYTEGTSEKIVGEFVADQRDRFVIATKYTLTMRPDDPNASGNHRKNMMQSVEASLKRLNTDYIDLYWLHAWDFMTPVEEVMRGLDDLVSTGKVRYIGISDTPAWIVAQANTLAELRGWNRFVGLQIEYSLIQRTPERELLPMAHAFDMAVTPWAVIGGGVLTGKYTGDPEIDAGADHKRTPSEKRINPRNLAIVDVVKAVSAETGHAPSQIAINWARRRPGLIIPIIGARKAEQMRENLGCLDWSLSDKHFQQLNDASAIELGFPHDFLKSDNIRRIVLSDRWPDIDNHRGY
jgi:aryl-alcohol dehydrogenase-like predicted oxidoreductase